jgi:outer membrane protein
VSRKTTSDAVHANPSKAIRDTHPSEALADTHSFRDTHRLLPERIERDAIQDAIRDTHLEHSIRTIRDIHRWPRGRIGEGKQIGTPTLSPTPARSRSKRFVTSILGWMLITASVQAQEPIDFDTQLGRYLEAGFTSNLELQSEHLEVEKATAALDQARAAFFPSLNFEARYTRADGGREIEQPLGSLMNPVYGTLNDLLVAQGRAPAFGSIEDQTIPFLREREQDTRLSLRQPLFAPGIPAAVRAQRAFLGAADYRRMAIARALRRDVTLGYLNWLKAQSSVQIVAASEALLQENLRVNRSLLDNGKVTEDQVLRANAELLAVVQQRREAANAATQAQSYLNFLLNRDLTTPLISTHPPAERATTQAALESLWTTALARRPEVAAADALTDATAEQVRLARYQRWPTVAFAVDAGTQGEDYGLGDSYNFATASIVFTWRVFNAGSDRAQVSQARAAQRQAELRESLVAQQIRFEVQQAHDRLQTAMDSLATADARAQAARAAFRIAGRKRDEGVINQVEFIDARSAMTGAELNYNLTRFEVHARRAELEHATSTGEIPLSTAPALP